MDEQMPLVFFWGGWDGGRVRAGYKLIRNQGLAYKNQEFQLLSLNPSLPPQSGTHSSVLYKTFPENTRFQGSRITLTLYW